MSTDNLSPANPPSSPKRRGLGRGLNALFEDNEDSLPQTIESHAPAIGGPGRRTIGIDQLEPGPFQPRRTIAKEPLEDLAASIATHGVLQPILVRENPGAPGMYQIIAGERRWRASQKAQLHEIPVIVRELSDEEATEIALIENLQREDLNAIEEALTYERLMNRFNYTQEKLSTGIGKSRSHIANILRLLTLPESVQTLVMTGKLSAGHARALIGMDDPLEAARAIVEQGLSVRDTEKLAATKKGRTSGQKSQKPGKDVDTIALEQEISNALGMKVTIDASGKGGVMKIAYKNLDQLDEVLHRLSHRS
ncbi:MAG: ParB/RepB/Spo0J family partition protein [Rhodospirillales bacterium]|nr:ParB/RepB/Spo0J family partition protein [Rhodospirillales bacterium]